MPKTETLDAVEDVVKEVEKVIPPAVKNDIQNVANKPSLLVPVVAVAAVAVGAAGAYLILRKRLEKKYQDIADAQVADVKEHYEKLYKQGEYADPVAMAEARIAAERLAEAQDIISDNEYASPDAPEPVTATAAPATRNVFEDHADAIDREWDYELEMRQRTVDFPYVIHEEEFLENEREFDQVSITYYDEDDVLADTQDNPIGDTNSVVGDINLTRFGHGSSDPMVVHVRNEKLQTDYEISKSEGSYAKEVHGQEPVIQHSYDGHRTRSRRRGFDDD